MGNRTADAERTRWKRLLRGLGVNKTKHRRETGVRSCTPAGAPVHQWWCADAPVFALDHDKCHIRTAVFASVDQYQTSNLQVAQHAIFSPPANSTLFQPTVRKPERPALLLPSAVQHVGEHEQERRRLTELRRSLRQPDAEASRNGQGSTLRLYPLKEITFACSLIMPPPARASPQPIDREPHSRI